MRCCCPHPDGERGGPCTPRSGAYACDHGHHDADAVDLCVPATEQTEDCAEDPSPCDPPVVRQTSSSCSLRRCGSAPSLLLFEQHDQHTPATPPRDRSDERDAQAHLPTVDRLQGRRREKGLGEGCAGASLHDIKEAPTLSRERSMSSGDIQALARRQEVEWQQRAGAEGYHLQQQQQRWRHDPFAHKTARDIRHHYAAMLGIRHPLEEEAVRRMAQDLSCLPPNFQVMAEELKGLSAKQGKSHGGFLRLFRSTSSTYMEPTEPPSCPPTTTSSYTRTSYVCTRDGKRKAGGLKVGEGRRLSSHVHVHFIETVTVVEIPSHREYSKRVKAQYWSSADEVWEMACVNMIEFEYEGGDYVNALEEDKLLVDEATGLLIHPAHVTEQQGLVRRSSEDETAMDQGLSF